MGPIGAAQADDIAGVFVPKAIAKHDLLLRAGKVSDDYFFLDSGFMRAFAHTDAAIRL